MRAKKSFGQHFLTNEGIARRIASSLIGLAGGAYRHVVEVGPGKGMLTKYLLEQDIELKVVEADQDMVAYLQENYPRLDGKIIAADFLKLQLDALFPPTTNPPFAIIGNFPYNISSQIVFKMLDYRALVPELVGMFQREMAVRIIAPPGNKDYGVISVLTQAFYEGEYLFSVDNGNFSPPPKVQSAVIRLVRKDAGLGCDEALFRRVVKQAFSQRRKMLRNTLKPFFDDDPAALEGGFFQKRPEVLSVQDFVDLTRIIGLRPTV